jgi:hypothetical protein
VENLNDYKDTHDDGIRSFSEVMYLTSSKENVVLVTDESFQLQVMYKGAGIPGDIKPAKNPRPPSNTGSTGVANNAINSGTNSSRGGAR